MPRNFAQDITNLRREAEALKISYVKSAAAIRTKAEEVSLTFTLSRIYDGQIEPDIWYVSAETIMPGQVMASAVTLFNDGITIQNHDLNARTISIDKIEAGDYNLWKITLNSANSDDINIITDGGTVELAYKFTVTGTSDYTIGVSKNA